MSKRTRDSLDGPVHTPPQPRPSPSPRPHPHYSRFGARNCFGEILPTSGYLVPDDAYEIRRLEREVLAVPEHDVITRLEVRARLHTYSPSRTTDRGAQDDIHRGQKLLIQYARATHGGHPQPGHLRLQKSLAILCPGKHFTPGDQMVSLFKNSRLRAMLGDTANKSAIQAAFHQVRPLTLNELAALEDEIAPATTPPPTPDPIPTPLPWTPTPVKEWNPNTLYGRLDILYDSAKEDTPDVTPPPLRYGVPRVSLDALFDLSQDDAPAFGDIFPPLEPDPEPLPFPDDDATPEKPRKRRGQHRTPQKPLCTFVVDAATGATCQRQVLGKAGARFCSAHHLHARPGEGAYCVVCYFLAEGDAADVQSLRDNAFAAMRDKRTKRKVTEDALQKTLDKQWKQIPARRFFYTIATDRGALAKCSRHRDAVWKVPATFQPRHVNPNPMFAQGAEPPLV